MNPKLSIITINYNNLKGLKKTVESVDSQILKGFEYIVIDGGSTDGSAEYMESQSGKIDYFISEPDKGVYHAMNKGIKKASGEYLLFLNSGDHFINNEALEKSINFLENRDFVYFNLKVVDENKQFIKEYPDKLSFSYFVKDTLPHPATFIKKRIFDDFGLYDESLSIVADWKFFMDRICKDNLRYKKVDSVLSTFYLDGLSSDSKNRSKIVAERQKVLKTEYQAFYQDLDDVISQRELINVLRNSRTIKLLVRLGFLKKF